MVYYVFTLPKTYLSAIADRQENSYDISDMRKFATFKPIIDPCLELPPKGRRYFCYAKRESCLAREEWFLSWMVYRGAHSAIIVPNGRLHEYYLEEGTAMKAHRKWAQHVYETWPQNLENYGQRSKALLKAAKDLSESVKSKNNKLILKYYLNYENQAKDFSDYVMGAWSVIYYIEPEALSAFQKHQHTIMALEEPINYIKMQHDLLREPLAKVLERYGWLNTYSPHDPCYTLKDLKNIRQKTSRREIEKQFKTYAENKKNYQTFRNKIKNRRLRKLVDIVHAYSFLKTGRMDIWKQSMHMLKPFFEYLTRLIPGTVVAHTVFLSSQEIEVLLNSGSYPPLDNLQKRKNLEVTYYYHRDRLTLVPSRSACKDILARLDIKSHAAPMIKGICANKGKVKGRARIVLSARDLHKIKKGDIFVAPYTFPTFMHAMKKCMAIITDEGGITSHAAIISREYNIPCVIGTKIATKALKDDDLIEVDADSGTVKII